MNYRYNCTVKLPVSPGLLYAFAKGANISEDRLVIRMFIDTVRTQEPEAAIPFLCGELRNSRVLDLGELKEFFSEGSEYKILNSMKKSDINVKIRKNSVMVADPRGVKCVVHIYMRRESDGNWRVFSMERE